MIEFNMLILFLSVFPFINSLIFVFISSSEVIRDMDNNIPWFYINVIEPMFRCICGCRCEFKKGVYVDVEKHVKIYSSVGVFGFKEIVLKWRWNCPRYL